MSGRGEFIDENADAEHDHQEIEVSRVAFGIERPILEKRLFGSVGHIKHLSAFFDSRSDAEDAVSRLKDADISKDAIRLVPGYEADGHAQNSASDDHKGIWASLEDFFFTDSDRLLYSEGLRHGGFLVSVTTVKEALYETAREILDDEGSVDLDERADQWRNEGWNETASTSDAAASTYDRNRSTLGISNEDTIAAETSDDTIKVVEENLRVGQREVKNGSVKVRHSADRPLSDADITEPHDLGRGTQSGGCGIKGR